MWPFSFQGSAQYESVKQETTDTIGGVKLLHVESAVTPLSPCHRTLLRSGPTGFKVYVDNKYIREMYGLCFYGSRDLKVWVNRNLFCFWSQRCTVALIHRNGTANVQFLQNGSYKMSPWVCVAT